MRVYPRLAPLRRPLAVWLALLIVVFAAIAPTLSHALVWARAAGEPTVEVCTPAGMRWVVLKGSTDFPDGPKSVSMLEHCPFCLHATDRVVPPPQVSLHDFGVLGEPVAPALGQAFLLITHFAPAPPPRGPPRDFAI